MTDSHMLPASLILRQKQRVALELIVWYMGATLITFLVTQVDAKKVTVCMAAGLEPLSRSSTYPDNMQTGMDDLNRQGNMPGGHMHASMSYNTTYFHVHAASQ